MPVQTINFHIKGDSRGSLIACEQNHNIPFDIKRVYYIFNTAPDAVRGKHAHKTLGQILVCISGSCDISTEENGRQNTYYLNSPTHGLYISGLVWREMSNFSPDAVLLVLASDYYKESDYIRNYKDFLRLTKEQND
ncbi:MAG: FdtA/QdtA family cupin domain-containing protein [bacterium]|nr:FdtA/QdtA family cupin domain-containing protein [bacterium]